MGSINSLKLHPANQSISAAETPYKYIPMPYKFLSAWSASWLDRRHITKSLYPLLSLATGSKEAKERIGTKKGKKGEEEGKEVIGREGGKEKRKAR